MATNDRNPVQHLTEVSSETNHKTKKNTSIVARYCFEKTPHIQLHIELVRGGILCAIFYHRMWGEYPGNSWDLEHAQENLLRQLEINIIAQRRSTNDPYIPWSCIKKDVFGQNTTKEIFHSVFVRIPSINKPMTSHYAQKWAEMIATVCQGLWKYQRRCTFQFQQDHTPEDHSQMRFLSDIITTTDTLKVAKLCFPSKTLTDILDDADTLKLFFPCHRFQELHDYYGTFDDVYRGRIMAALKAAASWEHP